MPEHQSGGHLMLRTAVNLWVRFLVLCATAFVGAVLLASGPATAAPVTGVTGTTGSTAPYAPITSGATVTPATTAPTTPAPVTSPTIAFTGADLAIMFTIGAVAIGVGGTLVLVTRRRRSENLA
jgi:hypothetical protein